MGSLMAPIDLTLSDLERSKSCKVIQVSCDRRAVLCKYIFPSSIFDMSLDVTFMYSVVNWQVGFSAVPVVFLVLFYTSVLM